ncbi:MAG: DUF6445 family protein [Paraglaciecola sp.]|uniref:DUF6445 family protein n=1 Tax=Paraglaciecola sp. TaxID=1920173 RepID=UPI00273F5E3C|nr:DUF6445 family protein [Paraglaciecola sp.]MDP5031845.1 DUF6445 family protein [Paraglaciecola sp.]MDP5132730.1 DUF6445 family protein [Paraglaciecola sp.]
MQQLTPSDNMIITKHTIGDEALPLLVVDNFIAEPEALIQEAGFRDFSQNSPYYPGHRAEAPLAYQQCLLACLTPTLVDVFQLPSEILSLSVCHYSVVTTPPTQLKLLQRIPHFDSLNKHGLAAVHYLFHGEQGGTSFYRHRKTGFESIDESRKTAYFSSLENENDGPNMPKMKDGYINGDTPLFTCIEQQRGIYNRIIVYRRNTLHSGAIPSDFKPPLNLLDGRLTISSFIDCI